jgi:uncharacterized protein YndB with AHSA1/START domain
MKSNISIDPKLDLILERNVDVKPEFIWKAWTDPKLLMQWFCPRPWMTIECEMDLRPGGQFRSVMQSPDGQTFPNTGCFLEIETGKKLVWTSVLLPGFRPAPEKEGDLPFTAVVTIEPNGKGGTLYTAIAIHQNEDGKKRHEQMGFHEGWGAAFEQMMELSKKM